MKLDHRRRYHDRVAPRRAKSIDPSSTSPVELSLGEWVCLALVDEGVNHGWAIGTELGPEAELGRVWSLSRPLTYRAVEQLAAKELIHREARPQGRGRERLILTCKPEGLRLLAAWPDRPVAHVRDVRSELLLKLVLRRRRGIELESLLETQLSSLGAHFEILTTAGPGGDVVDVWRRESARAVRRFLETALAQIPPGETPKMHPVMRLSARNQLRARVTSVTHGDVLSTVKTTLADGQRITAVITKESVSDLDIAPDDEVLVVIKSTEVMLAKP